MPVKRTKGGFVTKKEAQEYCGVLRGDKRRSSNLTFCQIYEQWESFYCGKIGKSTLNCYRAARKYYADIEYLRFSDIGLDDLQDCLDSCPRGKRTKENMKALGTLLYKYALPRHLAEMNYAQYIDCGDDKKHPRNALTLEHVEMIRAAIGCIKYADYVYCLIYTGFRPNEMLRLTVDDYDSANETLTGGSKTDAGIDRPITLSPKITPIVKRLASTAHPYLFPKPDGKQMRDDYFRESCFYQLLDELRIQSVPKVGEQALYTPYSCRHTFANLMKNVSGSDTDKAALMGHTSPEMTKYYQSADLASLRAITDKL
jgi:integrase